jgi:hypothetical protein
VYVGGAQRLGQHDSPVHERSPYTALSLRARPLALTLLVGGALLAAWRVSARRAQPVIG